MFYFVPSWYKEGGWTAPEPSWYQGSKQLRFDDTTSQARLFSRAGQDVSLLVLDYKPHMRDLLHRGGLFGVSYWSFFDRIQNVFQTDTHPIDYRDLAWPEGTELVYNPFVTQARRDGQVFAIVYTTESGNLLSVDWFDEGILDRSYYFDDRGFLSSIAYYDPVGGLSHKEFLNMYGVWQLREQVQSGIIEVNPVADAPFKKQVYANWEEVMREFLSLFEKEMVTPGDVLVVASDPRHNHFFEGGAFAQSKKVYSFFDDRYRIHESDDVQGVGRLLQEADLVVVDTQQQEEAIRPLLPEAIRQKVLRMTPFDTRLHLGTSQTVSELVVFFCVDSVSREIVYELLPTFIDMMVDKEEMAVKLISFDPYYDVAGIEDFVMDYIEEHDIADKILTEKKKDDENQVGPPELELVRLKAYAVTLESDIIQHMDTARLVVDLGEEPNLYVQIAAISAGIPQINRVETEYVDNGKNGLVIEGLQTLPQAIHYYFEGLSHWNDALVYAVNKMTDYTSNAILDTWLRHLKETRHESITNRTQQLEHLPRKRKRRRR